jgi:hypothetical protein
MKMSSSASTSMVRTPKLESCVVVAWGGTIQTWRGPAKNRYWISRFFEIRSARRAAVDLAAEAAHLENAPSKSGSKPAAKRRTPDRACANSPPGAAVDEIARIRAGATPRLGEIAIGLDPAVGPRRRIRSSEAVSVGTRRLIRLSASSAG